MANQGVKRNLEQGGGVYITHWVHGLDQQRSPIYTPISAMGIQLISAMDALWDGLNVELSRTLTLQRRFGFSRYCSVQFGSSDHPLTYYSFKNLSGTIFPLVDTPTKLYTFSTSSITAVFTKTSTAQLSIEKWQNLVYVCNGNDADLKKWNGTTVSRQGIVAPATAPTLSFSAGSLSPVSAAGFSYGYCYRNSSTGHVSTMSHVSANTGPQTSKNISVGYTASTDAQVDKIWIFRTKDGGSLWYFLAEVANGSSTYTDATQDSGLNTDIVAPTAHVNDPPPTGMSLMCTHLGRFWSASGSTLYFAAGPDCTLGNGAEAWPPANNFALPDKIVALASTTAGLLVFTSDDIYIVYGENASSFSAPQPWQENFGIATQNCVAQDGDLIYVFTSKGQLFQIGNTIVEVGEKIQAALGAFNPSNVYMALHRSGPDEGLFVSDGSTNVYRYSVMNGCWSPLFQPVGGCGAVGSIEATTNNWALLMGRNTGSGYILARNTTLFTDDGQSYSSYAVVGSLVLAPPRQVAIIGGVLLEASATGTYPTVSVLLNEVSGTFTTIGVVNGDPSGVPDPPELAASQTIRARRHDLKSAASPLPQHVRHMQVKVDFGNIDTVKNELYSLSIA